MASIKRHTVWFALTGLWLAVVLAGLAGLWTYSARGDSAIAAQYRWPEGSAVSRDVSRPTLIMFVHPQCPCSKASAEELSHLLAQCDKPVTVRVVAIQPAGVADDWSHSELLQTIRSIPGVAVTMDRDGGEVRRFGARTSGHAMLFDVSGRLAFSGGITSARGHAGDNAGVDAVVAIVNADKAVTDGKVVRTSVYGCSLLGSELEPK